MNLGRSFKIGISGDSRGRYRLDDYISFACSHVFVFVLLKAALIQSPLGKKLYVTKTDRWPLSIPRDLGR